MFKVPSNFPTFALNFDLTPIEEDFLLHLVWKAPPKIDPYIDCARSELYIFIGHRNREPRPGLIGP